MHSFDYYFVVYVLQLLLRHSDNLSKSLENSDMSSCEGQALAAISIKTLEILRNNGSFDSIWYLIKRDAASLELPEPTIPRKRKKPTRYLG